MFGCDICQDVCPWNRFSEANDEVLFNPKPELLAMSKEEWIDLSSPVFEALFDGSAVKRAKYEGLKKNIAFLEQDKRL